ncbi:MAG TPA: tRNA pseudouridine(55) synthase TruB [Candidatus Saccharimonadales bacterium]|nr:tRNA pseudouridine(55) synthase TruB [Candidatus Saccharimonadales bacterium]
MIILIDKEKGWTSHDVVAKLRGILHERKIGHAGTLDPNATGLLVVGTGIDTKKLGEITKNTNKTYEAEIVLGKISTTDDIDGEVSVFNDQIIPTESEIKNVLTHFVGSIEQIPPAFSAIKINGKKSYELARKGKEVKLEPRKVKIHNIEFVSYKYPVLKITCEVSSGTYIRSLARDIGQRLGTGAYLSNLRRTKVGEYSVSKAVTLLQLQKEQK